MPNYFFTEGTYLIGKNSMLAGIFENCLRYEKLKAKVRYFPGARPDEMCDYMKPLLRKLLDYIIL